MLSNLETWWELLFLIFTMTKKFRNKGIFSVQFEIFLGMKNLYEVVCPSLTRPSFVFLLLTYLCITSLQWTACPCFTKLAFFSRVLTKRKRQTVRALWQCFCEPYKAGLDGWVAAPIPIRSGKKRIKTGSEGWIKKSG